MILSARRPLLVGSVLLVIIGGLLLVGPERIGPMYGVPVMVAGLLIAAAALWRGSREVPGLREESDDIDALGETRRRELIRGTSLFLRELRYRYSIRFDPGSSERRSFTAEVNTVRLGFVPAVIIDNTTDRQGFGYVAFVHDGRRWRGPGLPCPADQTEAVRHASRCVSPLASDEETTIVGAAESGEP